MFSLHLARAFILFWNRICIYWFYTIEVGGCNNRKKIRIKDIYGIFHSRFGRVRKIVKSVKKNWGILHAFL
jgi:hypothetical protein